MTRSHQLDGNNNNAAWNSLSLSNYIKKNSVSDGLTIFHHIPKTAGSSLVREMRDHIGGYHPFHVNYKRFSGGDINYHDIRPQLESEMHSVIDEALVKYSSSSVHSMSGHFYASHMKRLLNVFPSAFFFTFLRHPVARVVSDYRYQCTPQHPPHRSFIREYPTIMHYLDNEDDHNKSFDYLLGRDVQIVDGISYIENNYSFIGIQEMYPMSFNILFRFHGINAFPKLHIRPTQNLDVNAVKVTDKLRLAIMDRNKKDASIYDHFFRKMMLRRDEWRSLVGIQ